MSRVMVVSTGTANTASVLAGLRRAGAEPELTIDPDVVRGADRVMLPGVGAFAAAMERLRDAGLVEALRERIHDGRPTLGICLGLQLLCDGSEESPGVPGLGVAAGQVRRFGEDLVVPQMGWNRVTAGPDCRWLEDGWAYFANSYRLVEVPEGWAAAVGHYGGDFVAAMERGDVVACQFHPELSGGYGGAVLGRWLGRCQETRKRKSSPVGRADEPGLGRRVIPCLDVRGGRIVKGVQFQGLRDAGDPAERARRYADEGADEIVLLDVSATLEARGNRLETVRRVREVLPVPLTVGGGVRSVQDAAALLGAGADKVAVNSAAVANPELLTELAQRFGRQCIVLAIDAQRVGPTNGSAFPKNGLLTPSWTVVTRSGTSDSGLDAVDWARRGAELGAGEILLTSWDRDGTRTGYDTELLRAVGAVVRIPVIASGGADTVEHMADGLRAGASAVLAASIFHFDGMTSSNLKQQLRERGVEVRP